MSNVFLIMFGAILTENFIFAKFYGICPFLGVS
ncbi:MAG: electron transport complex subunit RsxA, partial [Clostridia bacterium]|nr:electron transport complex subunit RsxA [Clostridia bacterium]